MSRAKIIALRHPVPDTAEPSEDLQAIKSAIANIKGMAPEVMDYFKRAA